MLYIFLMLSSVLFCKYFVSPSLIYWEVMLGTLLLKQRIVMLWCWETNYWFIMWSIVNKISVWNRKLVALWSGGGPPPLMQDVPLRLQGREKQNRNSSPPWLEGGFSNGPNLQHMGFQSLYFKYQLLLLLNTYISIDFC